MKTLANILTATCLAFLSLPASPQGNSKPVAVVHPADLSGPGADFGRDFSLGAKVYFDHINSQGGLKGRRISYRTVDTAGEPSQALSAAQQAIGERTDSIIFGVTGDRAVESIAQDQKWRNSGAPLFAAVAGNTSLGINEGVFFLRASLADEIRSVVSQLKNLGVTSFGLASADEFMRSASTTLAEEASRQGIRLTGEISLPMNAEGASNAASKLAGGRPQAVIVIGDTLSAAYFFKRYRALDPGAFLCAPAMVNFRTLTSIIGSQAARGLIISQVTPNPGGTLEIAHEHRRLMEKYADEPVSPATLEGFIAARMLVSVLQKSSDTTASAIRQAVSGDSRYNLGGYELSFSKQSGSRPSRLVDLSVMNRDGRLLR